MKKLFTIIMPLALIFASCQKEEEIGRTAVQEMAGDWFVQYSIDSTDAGVPIFADDYFHFSTYNTASNSSTEIWLDDLETFWEFKGKVQVNLADMTFSTSDFIQNEYYDSKFSVDGGKIIKNGTKGPGSGAPTDSIFFQVKFDDDSDEDTYTFSGYRKTGFLEDEH